MHKSDNKAKASDEVDMTVSLTVALISRKVLTSAVGPGFGIIVHGALGDQI